MTLPQVVTREEWLVARKNLLEREKEFTRTKDALNADRRRLPMVRVDKRYELEGSQGKVGLVDLFEGRSQLIIQHFMFDPAWDKGCSSCTGSIDELSAGLLKHLRTRDTSFALVSRAPFEKLRAYQASHGWDVAWYSSYGSDFNYDFHTTLDASVAPIEFNYRGPAELQEAGLGWILENPGEQPGVSCFLRDGDDVFLTYFTTGRGTEQLGGTYAYLDMTALGRQEDWEEPKGRSAEVRPALPVFSE